MENDYSYISFQSTLKGNVLTVSAQQNGQYGVGKEQSHWIQIPNVSPNFKVSKDAPKMTTLYDPFTLELYLQLAPIKVQTEKALFSFEITFDVDPIKQVQQLSELPIKFYRARVIKYHSNYKLKASEKF